MNPTACPSEEVLEAIARGDSVDSTLDEHVASCSSCQRAIDEIQDNNSFLELFAGEISDIESNELEAVIDAPLPEILPGGYRVEYEIHRGGQGVIYRATQIRTKRSVAVKMLILGSSASERQQSRFEREAEIIASLRHPGIVTIYDAGRLKDGRFGFAMEFIDGLTLDLWAEQRPVESKEGIRARLSLFVDICDAVSFAHQQGVVHRDLKPANILIDKIDKPHILDFGIAKALEPVTLGSIASIGAKRSATDASVHQTQPGEFAGTLAYASPEQVSGDPRSIDMRTDVYSLGIILYHLMTGRFPYEVDGSLQSVIHRIKNESPDPPSAHAKFLDKDINEIVLRALRKDKDRRYASVADFHQDVKLYLEGRPIDTRRDSAWYVVNKTVRLHWLISSVSIASVVLLAVFAVMMTVLYSQKSSAEIDALLQLRARNILHAHTEELLGDGSLTLSLLWGAQLESNPGLPPPESIGFGGAFEPLDSYWELWSFYSRNPCLKSIEYPWNRLRQSAMSPDGTLLATFNSGTIQVRSLPELELIHEVVAALPPSFNAEAPVYNLVYSEDQKSVYALTESRVVQWNIDDGSLIRADPLTLTSLPNTTAIDLTRQSIGLSSSRFAISPVGVLAGGFQSPARFVQLSDPSQVFTLDTGEGQSAKLRFSNDGNLLATVTVDAMNSYSFRSTASVWEMPEATLRARVETEGRADFLLFSLDGQSLILSNAKSEVVQWDTTSSDTPISTLAFDGITTPYCWFGEQQYLVASTDRTLSLLDSNSGKVLHNFSGHPSQINNAIAPPASSSIVSFGNESAMVWEPATSAWETIGDSISGSLQEVAISPDGRRLAWTKGAAGTYSVVITDLDSKETQLELIGPQDLVNSVSFGRDGRLLASTGYDGVVFVWDTQNGEILHKFTQHEGPSHTVSMSPTANMLASGGDDHKVILHDLDTGQMQILEGHTNRVTRVVFSPDGRLLASCSMDGAVRLWDVRTGNLHKVYEFKDRFHALSFSPDGVTLAVGGEQKSVILIDISSDVQSVLQEVPGVIFALAFGPDGRVLVSGDNKGNLSLWDVERKNRLTRLPGHQDMIMSIVVSPDGRSMATCSSLHNPEIRYWDLTTFAPHIAGNLEYQAGRLAKSFGRKPANLDAMRQWAAEIRGSD